MKRELDSVAVKKTESSAVFAVIAKVDLSALCPLWFRLRGGRR